MKNIFPQIIITFLFIFTINSVQPPLWPEWFSQSMSVHFTDLNTTGSYWYDSEFVAERYDFANGNTKTGCGAIHPMNTPCTHLIRDGWFFMIYPQKNLCCKLFEGAPLPRDWLVNYTLKGQQQIDGDLFNVWDQNLDNSDQNQLFYIQADGQYRPRRQTCGDRIFFDYWLSSFNNTKPKSSLFDVPSYCQKRCWDYFETEQDYRKLQRNLMKLHKGLLQNQRFQKFTLTRQ